ncbi:SDR family oxidoreductase [Agitococcus lubricus]|uniref:Dihydroflavonol-4-reductase n=1 Tax=Agitococcus lubricus TaxID=1077255 RepID=A0A2T5IYZ1_9GAMM|nr:aldehyde reductase [Agitococcus lubricus]PTQ89220.1 dihydroflavonol-4-reductase [Agitococcus lubricus]
MTTPTLPESTMTPILVTGGSGYIASWIIKYLLEAGYTVHATVRDPAKQSSVGHLLKIAEQAKGTLKLFKADLLAEGSFNEAMQGCGIVMHTASPFVLEGFSDANEALVRPALEGTRNVLNAVNQCPTVHRVVLTSSVAAIYGDNEDILAVPSGVFTEEHWNTTSSVDHNPYQYSKAVAEREAWKLQKEQSRWDLVTINPAMVYGPSLTSGSQSASIDTLVQMGDGRLRTGVPKLTIGVVDVREVASAHLLAAFNPAAKGRFILNATELTMLKIGKILRHKYGSQYPFPRMEAPTFLVWAFGPLMGPITRDFVKRNVGLPLKFDNRRSRDILGVQYRPVEETFIEHFQQVIDDGLLKKKR